jgi:large subunit ribosomal protein L18
MATIRKAARQRIHRRIRKKVAGTAQRPRLAVHFSGKHIYAQVIDDDAGRTIAAASTAESRIRSGLPGGVKGHANQAAAELVGKAIAERSLAKNLDRVVFDRGGFLYHGKVKALADAARAGGLKF